MRATPPSARNVPPHYAERAAAGRHVSSIEEVSLCSECADEASISTTA